MKQQDSKQPQIRQTFLWEKNRPPCDLTNYEHKLMATLKDRVRKEGAPEPNGVEEAEQ